MSADNFDNLSQESDFMSLKLFTMMRQTVEWPNLIEGSFSRG